MKFKEGDKVKIIQRKSGNITGGLHFNQINGDVGVICYISGCYLSENEDGSGDYYGMYDNSNKCCFQDDDLELVSDKFILPEKWCVKVGDPATKSVFDKWRRSNTTYSGYAGSVGYLNQNGFFSSEKINMGVEITYDQFKTHVLKETMEPKQEDLIGRWLKALKDNPLSIPVKTGGYVRITGYNRVKCTDNPNTFICSEIRKGEFELMPKDFALDTKDPMEATLEEAKRRYPVGTKFMPAHTTGVPSEYCIVTDDCKFDLYSGGIASRITTVKNGIHVVWVEHGMHPKYGNNSLNRMVYYDGKWAEIVTEESKPKPEKWVPKVGDWVVVLTNKRRGRHVIGNAYQITSDKGDMFQLKGIDERGTNCFWYYSKQCIRKAEPHEIPKTEEPIQTFVVGKWYKNHPKINTYAKCLEITSSGFAYKEAIFSGEYYKGSVSTLGKHAEMIEASLDEIQEFLPNFHPDKVFVSSKPYEYTAKEALAELKRMGFKKGVKYVYMYEHGTYDEADIRTASYDPCICGTQYIDCGGGYLWSKENLSHLHRGPLLNSCDKIPLTVPQVSLWGEPAPSTPNYLDPASLLKKVQLPI